MGPPLILVVPREDESVAGRELLSQRGMRVGAGRELLLVMESMVGRGMVLVSYCPKGGA